MEWLLLLVKRRKGLHTQAVLSQCKKIVVIGTALLVRRTYLIVELAAALPARLFDSHVIGQGAGSQPLIGRHHAASALGNEPGRVKLCFDTFTPQYGWQK